MLQVYPTPSKEAYPKTNVFSQVFPSWSEFFTLLRGRGEGTSQIPSLQGVALSTGSRGGRALAKRSRIILGINAEVAIPPLHTHPRFAPSFPSPNDDQSQVKGLRAGGWVSEGLLLEQRSWRASSLLRALTSTFNIHTHCRTHTPAHTPVNILGMPRSRAAPAAALLQPPGNRQAAT